MSAKLAIFTEGEAKTKWCPEARRMPFPPQNPKSPYVYVGDGPVEYRDAKCVASACMFWRWFATHIHNPDNPAGDLIESGETYGYCGLAGRPTP